jgi:FdhD protein
MIKLELLRYHNNKLVRCEDWVALESVIRVNINSEFSFDVILYPADIKDFVYGNLYTEGFIRTKDDIEEYQEVTRGDLIEVDVKLHRASWRRKEYFKRSYNIVWTECGSTPELKLKRLSDKFNRFQYLPTVNVEAILNLHSVIKSRTELYKRTGALHYAFLFKFNKPKLILSQYAYDIGRHNAVDKVIGKHLLTSAPAELDFSRTLLYVTGRITSDIVFKCLRVRIPILVTRGAPLYGAVQLAKKYNMCIIGFLRGKRFNVYGNTAIIKI